MLKSYFEFADEDDDSRRSEKVEAQVRGLDPALAETLPYILSLLGIAGAAQSLAMMDAQVRRRRTLEAVKRIIIRESLKQPLVVIFEDLHWIDAETQALLDLLADSIANARVLMLVNYRPEYRHEWANKPLLLSFGWIRWAAERRRNALGHLGGREPAISQAAGHRAHRGQSFFYRRDGAGAVRRGRAGAQWRDEADAAAFQLLSRSRCRACWPRASTRFRHPKRTCCRRSP